MKAKKMVALGLAAGVVFSSFGVAEAAKKKPKKPKPVPAPAQVDQLFYMRRDACTGAAEPADNSRLSLTDGPDEEGNLCGWLQSGIINEAGSTSGQVDPVAEVWPVADGLPLVLDASKPITGKINVTSSYLNAAPDNGVAAGVAEMVVDITGVAGGEEIVVGSATVEYQVTPAASRYEVAFEITPEGTLDRRSFEELVMTTTLRGPNAGHGLYELDNPASTVTIPSWVTQ